jgi:hypothetical protein
LTLLVTGFCMPSAIGGRRDLVIGRRALDLAPIAAVGALLHGGSFAAWRIAPALALRHA